jgi:hypothetical protein
LLTYHENSHQFGSYSPRNFDNAYINFSTNGKLSKKWRGVS